MKNQKQRLAFLLLFLLGNIWVNAQTQLSNGNFEKWGNKTVNGFTFTDPENWHTLNQLQQFGFEESSSRTSDAYADSFAIVLETISSPFGRIPGLIAGAPFLNASGEPDMNLNFKPFTARPNHISFWFKSFPEQGDANAMGCLITKWNTQTNTRDTIAHAGWTMDSTYENYTFASILFDYNSNETPDSMSIIFSSSLNGFSPIVGSALYLDNIQLGYANQLEEINKEREYSVFPNPFVDFIQIDFTGKLVQAEILDISGKQLLSPKILASGEGLSLSNLLPGMYYLSLVEPETLATKTKIIVKNP